MAAPIASAQDAFSGAPPGREQAGRKPGDTPGDSAVHGSRDTLHNSMAVIDSLGAASPDTVKRIPPLRSVGSLSPASLPYAGPDRNAILWKDYRTITDLLSDIPGVFVRDMGSPGQDNQVTIYGADHTATAFLVDGISHNDPVTGTYNFAFFPVEAISRIEIVTGPRAFLYGDNAAGGTVNVVTKSFTNNKPYTQIRYSQGDYAYTQTDAMFSQNILARFNLSFGLSYLGFGTNKRSTLNRGRFQNSDNEAYSFRTKLRYNVSESVNLAFTHFFHRTQTSLNGGIDLSNTAASDVYDENAARVINPDAYEKMFNHHAALTGAYSPRGDSSLSVSVSLFGSHGLREYRDEENRASPNGVSILDNFESTVLGMRGQMDWDLNGNLFSAIGEMKSTRFEHSIYGDAFTRASRSLSLKDELTIADIITFAVFTRIENSQESAAENAGVDATIQLPESFLLTAGVSTSHRRLTIQETYLTGDGVDTTIQKMLGSSAFLSPLSQAGVIPDEIHTVTEAGIRFTPASDMSIGITATRRFISHWADRTLIKLYQEQDLTLDGITASVRVRSGDFFLDADGTYTHQTKILRNGTPIFLFPQWRGQSSLYFRCLLANGNLELKAGVKGGFFSGFDGYQFRIVDGIPNPIVNRQIGSAGTADLFAIAHIGDAHIHIMWENLTNSQYMLTPYYPMQGRSVRFGVSWEFLD